jgi:hypothetical protein
MMDAALFDEVEAQEEALIEGYLAGNLATDEYELFERQYLASPFRRRRVDGVRRLIAAAARPTVRERSLPGAHSARRWMRPAAWAALAAAAVIVIAARMWLPPRQDAPSVAQRAQEPAPAAPAPSLPQTPSPITIAFSLSPMTVRSAQDVAALSIPAGTTTVSLRLEGEPRPARARALQVVLRTVDGTEMWRGPARSPASGAPGVLAEAELPASVLTPDDYILELFESGPGRPQPIASYFVRLRKTSQR